MNTLSGYIELELGDQVLPFKFGTNCWALFCEMHKIEFHQIGESGIFGSEGVPPSIQKLRDLYFCAHQAAMRSKGELTKINISLLTDLLDETKGAYLKLQEAMLTAKMMGYTFSELAEENKKKVS